MILPRMTCLCLLTLVLSACARGKADQEAVILLPDGASPREVQIALLTLPRDPGRRVGSDADLALVIALLDHRDLAVVRAAVIVMAENRLGMEAYTADQRARVDEAAARYNATRGGRRTERTIALKWVGEAKAELNHTVGMP